MHNNYFFLRKLSAALGNKLSGWQIGSCFSQERNELVIGFFSGSEEFYIKADQNPLFSCLSFPDSFSRAKKNSVDLFPRMSGKRILDVKSYNFERAFSFILDQDLILLFKLFGNFSNIMLFEKENCIDVFKHNMNDEEKIHISGLDREIELNETSFHESGGNPKRFIPAIDETILEHLEKRSLTSLDKHRKWLLLKEILDELENPDFYIVSVNHNIKFRLFPEGKIIKKSTDPIHILNEFYYEHQKHFWLNREKSKLLKILGTRLKKTRQYLAKSEIKQREVHTHLDFRQKADIIMANLHRIKPGDTDTELFNFYHNNIVSIKLNPGLSPQKNAEQYYRKSKNQKIELEKIQQNIDEKKRSADHLDKLIQQIENLQDLKSLRALNQKYQIETSIGKQVDTPRFKSYEYMGFHILVGKNGKNNEELTFDYGYKDDLWLHAKDVSGSHVLIKYQAGKTFPKPVIEKAGQLAAYYSRNRNMNVCPVIYTEKKFVRKRKGASPGTVRVDKEKILFVNPLDHT